MKKLMVLFVLCFPFVLHAQFGVKAGLNFANVTKVNDINNSSETGFHLGVFYAPQTKSVLSSKFELLYSRQGYNYASSTNTGTVNLDYIMVPTLLCINITKLFQIQVGAQFAYLLNAKADSSNNTLPAGTPYAEVLDYYNRFDYGMTGGVEFHPFKGLLVGARYNISFSNLYKDTGDYSSGELPSFVPTVDVKNNVVQIFAGWTFGGTSKEKK